jgi:hypothetical protein
MFAMSVLVGGKGEKPFTAAKKLLRLAGTPADQLENQAHAAVRRFKRRFVVIASSDGPIPIYTSVQQPRIPEGTQVVWAPGTSDSPAKDVRWFIPREEVTKK